MALSLENACSIGVKSGSGGVGRQEEQVAAVRLRAPADYWPPYARSNYRARPPAPVAASAPVAPRCTTQRWGVFMAPSMSQGTRGPSGASAITRVVFLPWLRGAQPRGPLVVGRPAVEPRPGRCACRFHRQRRPAAGQGGRPPPARRCAPPRHARSLSASFFMRPAQAAQRSPHRRLTKAAGRGVCAHQAQCFQARRVWRRDEPRAQHGLVLTD